MKSFLFILTTLIALTIKAKAQGEINFSLRFDLKDYPYDVKKIIIRSPANDQYLAPISDSCIVNNKIGLINGHVSEPRLLWFQLKSDKENSNTLLWLYIDANNITVIPSGKPLDTKFSGSQESNLYQQLLSELFLINDSLSVLRNKLREVTSTDSIASINNQISQVQSGYPKTFRRFFTEHPATITGKDALIKYFGWVQDSIPDDVLNLWQMMPGHIKLLSSSKKFYNDLTTSINTAVGKSLQDFSLPDTNGKKISTWQFRGKYLFIDFWASWCVPCRQESPYIVAAYKKYHNKGLEILGVSLDTVTQKDKWLSAIYKDSLLWHHASELKYFDTYPAKIYGIKSIPFNLLIDPKGIIVAKNLRKKQLEKKLAEVLQ